MDYVAKSNIEVSYTPDGYRMKTFKDLGWTFVTLLPSRFYVFCSYDDEHSHFVELYISNDMCHKHRLDVEYPKTKEDVPPTIDKLLSRWLGLFEEIGKSADLFRKEVSDTK